jgi:hypothetical protein
MSTTFGIPQRIVDIDKICDENGDLLDYIDPSFFEKIFYRGNAGYGTRWLNSLASRLPDETKVFPLDNSVQGIYTIGDIKKLMDKIDKEKLNEKV